MPVEFKSEHIVQKGKLVSLDMKLTVHQFERGHTGEWARLVLYDGRGQIGPVGPVDPLTLHFLYSWPDPDWELRRRWTLPAGSDGYRLVEKACETEEYRPLLDWLTEHEQATDGPARAALQRLHELLRQEAPACGT